MSMALSQGQVQQQASMSVMKKAMDQAEGSAEFLNKMVGEEATYNSASSRWEHRSKRIKRV
jgi:3'-phosphoadenosine 5'-phosphosulfate sulfotransferase